MRRQERRKTRGRRKETEGGKTIRWGGGEVGGGSTSNTLTKGKIGREIIYYVYGLLCTM